MAADNRTDRRVETHDDIMFSQRSVHPFRYYGAVTLNHSADGMCVESRYPVQPGDHLCLRLIGHHLQSFTSLDELTCIAEVKWCETVGTPEKPAFRIGLRYHGGMVPPLFKPDE